MQAHTARLDLISHLEPFCMQLQCDQCVTCFFFLTTLSVAEKDISHVCWMSSGDQKDLSHQNKVQSRGDGTRLYDQKQIPYRD